MKKLTSYVIVATLLSAAGITPAQVAHHPDILVLTKYRDEYWAKGAASGGFTPLAYFGTIGYRFSFNASTHFQTLVADLAGDGLEEIVAIDGGLESYQVGNNPGYSQFAYGEYATHAGFHFSPVAGWRVFAGDFNGDGRDDLLQTTEYSDRLWTAITIANSSTNPYAHRIGALAPAGAAGFKYRPNEGWWIGVGDVNGDGRDDVIQSTSYRDAWVALSNTSGTFDTPSQWGNTGFQYDLTNHFGLVVGDFSGDGKADLLQITPYGDVWVAASTGSAFSTPTQWAVLGFKDAYGGVDTAGYAVFATDLNVDGKCDLLQLTNTGELWGANSTGSGFSSPTYLQTLPGVIHNEVEGGWHVLVGNFTDVPDSGGGAKRAAAAAASSRNVAAPTPTPSLTPTPAP